MAKNPKKKYSKTIIEVNSSISSKHQKSISQQPNTIRNYIGKYKLLPPPQVNRANIKIIAIQEITTPMYISLLKFTLKISSPFTRSWTGLSQARPIDIDTPMNSKILLKLVYEEPG